jgi:hypothetical protein
MTSFAPHPWSLAHPLERSLHPGPGLAEQAVRQGLEKLASRGDVQALVVFGSRGSDRCRPDSDLDLLVIGKEKRIEPSGSSIAGRTCEPRRDRKKPCPPAAFRTVSPSSLGPTFQRLSPEKRRRYEIGRDINAAGQASHARPSALDPPPQPAAVAEGGTHTEQGQGSGNVVFGTWLWWRGRGASRGVEAAGGLGKAHRVISKKIKGTEAELAVVAECAGSGRQQVGVDEDLKRRP